MYTVREAADILNLTTRAIQLKCKKANVIKIGNEFIISQETLNSWKLGKAKQKKERNEGQQPTNILKKNTQKLSFNYYYLYVFLLVIMFLSFIVYNQHLQSISTENQLEIKDEVIKATNEAKAETKETNNYLRKEIKILQQQNTILKDSLKKFDINDR